MGNRVKGKVKRKSVKAASHSGMGSKRKLSRMGKRRQKDHSGLDATFIGRASCLRRLQISLKDFRRLCILKGIYPREPRGRAPGNKKGQVYYHIKDVRAIAHEPVLEKFRELRAFMKKIRRAAGRNEKDEAARKNALLPSYSLHHLVRERYPRFSDALSDIDDALTLVYLFAALPSHGDIKSKVTAKAKSLAAAWGAYCATTSSITKGFISVKGVYLEATIRGIDIRWIIPHSFTQMLPDDVDYKVMLTFFEFYETFLNFVLFRLYNDLDVRFPMAVEDLGEEVSGSTTSILSYNLRSLTNAMTESNGAVSSIVSKTLESASEFNPKGEKHLKTKSKELIKSVASALKSLSDDESEAGDENEDNDVDVAGPLKAALDNLNEEAERLAILGPVGSTVKLDEEAIKRRRLFPGLTFYLSREVPRGYLELVCLAFGGRVGWEGTNSPIAASDSSITHHIVDRPVLPSSYDTLPKSREFVQPQWIFDCANFMFLLPVGKYAVGHTLPPHLSPWVDDEEEGYTPAYAEEIARMKLGEIVSDDGGHPLLHEDDVGVSVEKSSNDVQSEKEDVDEQVDKSEGEEEDGDNIGDSGQGKSQKEDKETHDLAKGMMSKKASRLYGRMQHGLAAKQVKVDTLQKRRKEIENPKGKTSDGKTPLKQKVERLRKERRNIEDDYTNTGGSMKKQKRARK